MGINKLILSPELIAALYPETLMAGKSSESAKKQDKPLVLHATETALFPFLGKNLQSICFLVSYPGQAFISEEKLVFLIKMLSACKFELDDIALLNIAGKQIKLDSLKIQFQPRILFLWGVQPADIGISNEFADLTISRFEEITIVPVLFPDLIIGDSLEGKELKKQLWACLQKLFNL